MQRLEKLYRDQEGQLLNEFRQPQGIPHMASRGTRLEEVLREFLMRRLPARCDLGRGQVITYVGELSQETDIAIYDSLAYRPLALEGSYQLFPVESVLGIVQVTSRLTKQKLFQDARKIASVKELRLPIMEYAGPSAWGESERRACAPYAVLFAYSSSVRELRTVERWLVEATSATQQNHRVDLVCVLGKGVVCWQDGSSLQEAFDSAQAEKSDVAISLGAGEATLLEFMLRISNAIGMRRARPASLWRYFKGDFRRIGQHAVELQVFISCRRCGRQVDWTDVLDPRVVEDLAERRHCVEMTEIEAIGRLVGAAPIGLEGLCRDRTVLVYDPRGHFQAGELPGITRQITDENGHETTVHFEGVHSWFNGVVDDTVFLVPEVYMGDVIKGACPYCASPLES